MDGSIFGESPIVKALPYIKNYFIYQEYLKSNKRYGSSKKKQECSRE
jgi:hypothetical protein